LSCPILQKRRLLCWPLDAGEGKKAFGDLAHGKLIAEMEKAKGGRPEKTLI
jgi:hypothetical protein